MYVLMTQTLFALGRRALNQSIIIYCQKYKIIRKEVFVVERYN